MKKIFLLGLATVLSLASCQKQRYTQQSAEIDVYKKVIEAYEKQNWQDMASHYADTAKILLNATKNNAQTVAQMIDQDKKDAGIFSGWKFVASESEYEMVVTDDGETWVNFWGLWQGTLKANSQMYEIPVHLTARFIDGKVVRECGYWDNSRLMIDIEKTTAAALPANPETLQSK